MIRAAMLIVSAVSSGLALGKSAATKEVARRRESAIAEAAEQARTEIRERARSYVADRLWDFAANAAIKLAMIGAVWIVYALGWITGGWFAIVAGVVLVGFLARDIWRIWPSLRLLHTELKRHGWKPKRAIGEIVAANVFDEVVAKAAEQKQNWQARVVLALAGTDRDEIAQDVARAVADIAREVTWDDLKPFMIVSALRFGVLMAIYSAFVWFVIASVN